MLGIYFAIVYAVSLAALIASGVPRLTVFPFLIASVALTGIGVTWVTGGRRSVRELWDRMSARRVPRAMYATLLLPPVCVLMTLTLFAIANPAFRPGLQLFGIPIGLVAGFLEETGWTGFAYPRMKARFGPTGGALLLGVMWGVWHAPVVDSLGAASPHGDAWPAFFLAFIALVTTVRSLIAWTYNRTGSLLLAQLMHASFTGTLILFSAPRVSPWQEAAWYAGYAALLGAVLAIGWAVARTPQLRFSSR